MYKVFRVLIEVGRYFYLPGKGKDLSSGCIAGLYLKFHAADESAKTVSIKSVLLVRIVFS